MKDVPPPTADSSSGAGRLNVHPIRGTPKRSLSAPIARRCAECRSADANLWSQQPKRLPNCATDERAVVGAWIDEVAIGRNLQRT